MAAQTSTSMKRPRGVDVALTPEQRREIPELIKAVKVAGDGILEFWSGIAYDAQNGGFYPAVSNDLTPTRTGEKRVVITARGLWVFSEAYRESNDQRWKEMADNCYAFLQNYFDREKGGMFWTVDEKGKLIDSKNELDDPVGMRKQLYAQGFALYGLAAYAQVTGKQEALDQAKEQYELILRYGKDHQYGGYLEAFDQDWKVLERPAMNPPWDLNSAKSTNTHLHLIEAFSQLLKVWPDVGVFREQAQLVSLFCHKVLDENGHLKGYMTADFSADAHPDSPTAIAISYGHDIEAAWLVKQAVDVLSDTLGRLQGSPSDIAEVRDCFKSARDDGLDAVMRLAEVSYREGRDSDGSIFHEYNYNHIPGNLDKDKHWWPQAEALVGYLAAFEVSNDPKYYQAFTQLWDYISHKMIHKAGEWYRHLGGEDNRPALNEPLVNEWKCPYHNWRATMEVVNKLKALIGE